MSRTAHSATYPAATADTLWISCQSKIAPEPTHRNATHREGILEDFLINPADIAGAVGVAIYLGAYAALQFGFLPGRGYLYPALNLSAAGFVVISLARDFNLASFAIQVSWIVISMIGMLRMFLRARKVRFNPEEKRFADSKLSTLEPHQARRLLDMGKWSEVPAGVTLTQQGFPVERLVYVADGGADLILDDVPVMDIQHDAFIGEITILKGGPATATVRINQPSRCFSVDAIQVRVLSRQDPAFARVLEMSFSAEVTRKIVSLNETLKTQGKPTLPEEVTNPDHKRDALKVGAMAELT